MHIKTKKRIFFGVLFFLAFAAGIAIILYNLSGNISFFVTPTELLAKPIHTDLKLGGYAKDGSVRKIEIDEIEFEITDRVNQVKVRYKGPIPAIFREGQGVVVTGSYDGVIFHAKELLAKHDEKYMPSGVKDKISKK